MKKNIRKFLLITTLILGIQGFAEATNVKAASSSPLPNDKYCFAVTKDATTTDMNGNTTATTLKAGTDWKVSNEFYHQDQINYQIASNIFVNQNFGYLYLPMVQTITTANHTTHLYDHNGNEIKNRALAPNSSWYSDRSILVDKITYCRVATDEFVALGDLV